MSYSTTQLTQLATEKQRYEALHQAVLIIHTLMELDDQWLSTQTEIVNALKLLWQNNLYRVS